MVRTEGSSPLNNWLPAMLLSKPEPRARYFRLVLFKRGACLQHRELISSPTQGVKSG